MSLNIWLGPEWLDLWAHASLGGSGSRVGKCHREPPPGSTSYPNAKFPRFHFRFKVREYPTLFTFASYFVELGVEVQNLSLRLISTHYLSKLWWYVPESGHITRINPDQSEKCLEHVPIAQ
jgi:hypothetical protein